MFNCERHRGNFEFLANVQQLSSIHAPPPTLQIQRAGSHEFPSVRRRHDHPAIGPPSHLHDRVTFQDTRRLAELSSAHAVALKKLGLETQPSSHRPPQGNDVATNSLRDEFRTTPARGAVVRINVTGRGRDAGDRLLEYLQVFAHVVARQQAVAGRDGRSNL